MSGGKDFPRVEVAGPAAASPFARLRAQQLQENSASNARIARKNNELGSGKDAAAESIKEHEAAVQFEALLLHQMFQAMWSTVPDDGLLSGSREEGYFRDMFTQGLADSIAKGQGIGIKEVIARELYKSDNKKQGSRE